MRTGRNFSPLLKLCSKIEPVSTLRSFVLITAGWRASLMCSTVTIETSCPSISNIVPLRKSLVVIMSLPRTPVRARAMPLEKVDDLALVVALEQAGLPAQRLRLRLHRPIEVVEGARAVHLGLARSQEVQVRSIDHEHALAHASALVTTRRTTAGGTP